MRYLHTALRTVAVAYYTSFVLWTVIGVYVGVTVCSNRSGMERAAHAAHTPPAPHCSIAPAVDGDVLSGERNVG